jgi:hypothetical protein
MPRRSSKHQGPKDINETAFDVVQRAIGAVPRDEPEDTTKNPHAVALGKLGGVKGGKARAKALSAKKRSEIARKAAAARWSRRP